MGVHLTTYVHPGMILQTGSEKALTSLGFSIDPFSAGLGEVIDEVKFKKHLRVNKFTTHFSKPLKMEESSPTISCMEKRLVDTANFTTKIAGYKVQYLHIGYLKTFGEQWPNS